MQTGAAHRGLNQVIVYSYPSLEELRRVDFPPIRRFFNHLGFLDDPRLGFHHSTLSMASTSTQAGAARAKQPHPRR